MWKVEMERKSGIIVGLIIFLLILNGCDKLNDFLDPAEESPTPTPTSFNTSTPTRTPNPGIKPTATRFFDLIYTSTPTGFRGEIITPTPTNRDDGNIYTTRKGEYLEFPLGERTNGTFYFEAKGFVEEKFPGDESWMKPVYFWISNDDSGFDYDGQGFLFQVLQLLHDGYWCEGGKLHLRNHGVWLGEVCYQFRFEDDRWYGFEITWADRYIHLNIDGARLASTYTNVLAGPITACIGWPPSRREGIDGLQYRNYGFR
ncbi:MAG: hypothetical protein A2161_19005 [Candidatus Schekmanbacteria bacterium RBG_13_48_7]|uniref:Uncharacterized protein n=1 Tax=Candidatus Schekmanbacteria bacterium RBG_13_48_7 TaxID=1817878 RepID=A0A1F7RLB4_9BACT|nr:MAG: hypothetical protein A2161_19005 [Candidatus Schekmanbacteria bacterium RBG_13_48_7]